MWVVCQLLSIGYALLTIVSTFALCALWWRKNDTVHEWPPHSNQNVLLAEQMKTPFSKTQVSKK